MTAIDESTRSKLFDDILQSNHARFVRVARSYANFGEQNDLLQEIWYQIWRSLRTFKGDAKLDTWAYKVALNTAISYVRKEIKSKPTEILEINSLEGNLTSEQTAINLLEAFLSSLNPIDKALFLLYLDGISQIDISKTLSLSQSNVGVKVSRIKSKFESMYMRY